MLLLSFAYAQEPAPPPESPAPAGAPEAAATPTASPADIARQLLQLDLEAERGLRANLENILRNAGVLLDDRYPAEQRSAAAAALADTRDVRVIPVLRAASQTRNFTVAQSALAAAARFPNGDATQILIDTALSPDSAIELRREAITLLGRSGLPDAGRALWAIAGEREVPDTLRSQAREQLLANFPGLIDELGTPKVVSNIGGSLLGVTANGVAGGVMLSAVGTWGRFDGGTTIGAVGGSAIGVGTGVLYTLNRPTTLGEGMAYASGVGWGLAAGVIGTEAIYGSNNLIDYDTELQKQNIGALLRVIGTGTGAAAGLSRLGHNPDPADVLEIDTAAYLGSAIALGATDLIAGNEDLVDYGCYIYDDYSYYYGYYYDSTPELDSTCITRSRARMGMTLVGAAAGAGAGFALNKKWELEPADALFAGVVAAEGAWLGGMLPLTTDTYGYEIRGNLRLGLHAAAAGALAITEFSPVTPQQSLIGAYGAVSANMLGAGIPLLAGVDETSTTTAIMLPVGLAGMAGGIAGAGWLAPDRGDWAMIGIGTPYITTQALALGSWMLDRRVIDEGQMGGLMLTSSSATALGLMVAGHYVSPHVDNTILLGTSAAWGYTYGALVPVALDMELEGSEVGLVSAGTADAFVLGGVALLNLAHVEPQQTILPQLLGLSGGTLGALGVALASTDGNDVALGAVIGSTVGLAGGAAVVATRRPEVSLHTELPGRWSPYASPTVLPDGQSGWQAGLRIDQW